MRTNQNFTFAALAAVGFTLATMAGRGQISTNMVPIPAGPFALGNRVAADTDIIDATPVSVTVSAFYMDKYEVNKALG